MTELNDKNESVHILTKKLFKMKWIKRISFLFAMIVIFSIYFIANMKINQYHMVRDLANFPVTEYLGLINSVDSIQFKGNDLIINGWAFIMNDNTGDDEIQIFVKSVTDSTNIYVANIERVDREDVNHHFECDYDYVHCGYVGTLNRAKQRYKDGCYEVFIKYGFNKNSNSDTMAYDIVTSTGKYIVNGELSDINPYTFKKPMLVGSFLEDVIRNGHLCAYDDEKGMYVYQFQSNLYWIADKDYEFEEDGSTYMQYQLWTTQPERLPKERLENAWYWDNIGFDFEQKEVLLPDLGSYRVAKSEIPSEYAIAYVAVGYFTDEWIWSKNFRPSFDSE